MGKKLHPRKGCHTTPFLEHAINNAAASPESTLQWPACITMTLTGDFATLTDINKTPHMINN